MECRHWHLETEPAKLVANFEPTAQAYRELELTSEESAMGLTYCMPISPV